MSQCFITGAAGFIGFHAACRLLRRGDDVFGVDDLNDYYDIALKHARLKQLTAFPRFTFAKADITSPTEVDRHFDLVRPALVVHLAAQPGVRYSASHADVVANRNLIGFLNVLEGCRRWDVTHLVYASSSSVYGGSASMPFSVHSSVDHPLSLYAATKRANELIAHSYSWQFGLPTTGLRFFTVYGPWNRPDMAISLFTKAILEGRPVELFNDGHMVRDFTYIDDAVDGITRVLDSPPTVGDFGSPAQSRGPFRLYNLGSNRPIELGTIVDLIESALGRKGIRRSVASPNSEVVGTCADIEELARDVGFHPSTRIEDGIARFIAWYRDYYQR